MKPWEESWNVSGIANVAAVRAAGDEEFLRTTADRDGLDDELAVARARLAAAAPDLVHVLLAIEHDCPACNTLRMGTHKPDCPLDAALRKAGVR